MSTPGSNIVKLDADLLVGGLVGASIAIVFIPVAWIFIYHVLKDRKAERKRQKARVKTDDVEWGRKPELSGDEKRNGGLYELEQPGMPELQSEDVKEMWDERCAKEKDGQLVALEMDAGSGLGTKGPVANPNT